MNEQLSLIQRFRKTVIGEYAEALIWAVALALVLTTFVVQAFKIPSTNSSMAFGILSMTTT